MDIQRNFIMNNLYWGVVESRNDPLQLGRLKVRWIGVHPKSLKLVPTDDLPWAVQLMPPTSASTSGIGTTPTGIVPGSWVIGTFLDGDEFQQPLVLGTVHAANQGSDLSPDEGFQDVSGLFPRANRLGNDVTSLARESAESHHTLLSKRDGKQKLDRDSANSVIGIETAKAPNMNEGFAPIPEAKKTQTPWFEPNPRYGGQEEGKYPLNVKGSTYPYNKVHETESGHIFEIDDTKNSERIHWYHTKGTFQEIQPSGDRVTKIVSDDYEIVADSKNVFIRGTCNLTVHGDMKTLVKGDHYLEVEGNKYETVHKDKFVKVGGSQLTEIVTDNGAQINGNNVITVSNNQTVNIKGHNYLDIGKSNRQTIKASSIELTRGKRSIVTVNNHTVTTFGKLNIAASNTASIGVKGQFTVSTQSNLKVNANGTVTILSGANTEMVSNAHVNIDSNTPTFHINLNS